MTLFLTVGDYRSKTMCIILMYIICSISLSSAQNLPNTKTALSDSQKSCIEQEFPMLVGIDNYIYSNYNFRESFYSIDAETSFYLETLVNILEAKGITLVKVIPLLKSITEYEYLSAEHPEHVGFSVDDNLQYYYQHLKTLNELGILAPNFYQPYAENHEDDDFYIDYDSHWSLLGSRLAALAISEAIQLTSNYEPLDKESYLTTVRGEYEFFGASKAFYNKCSVTIKPYKSKNLFTVLESESPEQLFADAGFLSQALSLNVLNWSKPNAKLEGSILPYFVSEEYQNTPPKFLIWESANFSFENPVKQLRQIIPAAIGGCDLTHTLHDASFNIQTTSLPEVYTLFENLEDVSANQHYLHLSYIGNTVTSKIDLIRIYSKFGNGEEDVKFLDYRFFDNSNHIFYLFSHLNHDLTSVSISLPQDIDIRLEAKLCTVTY